MKKSDKMKYNEIFFRIKEIKGFKTDGQVGEILGLSPSALSERKKTGSIPIKEICEWGVREGHSLDWLLTGEAPSAPPAYPPEMREYVDKLVAVLSGPDQRLAGKVEGYLDALNPQEDAGTNKAKKRAGGTGKAR